METELENLISDAEDAYNDCLEFYSDTLRIRNIFVDRINLTKRRKVEEDFYQVKTSFELMLNYVINYGNSLRHKDSDIIDEVRGHANEVLDYAEEMLRR